MSLSNYAIARARLLARRAISDLLSTSQDISVLRAVFGEFDLDAAWSWVETEVNNGFGNFPTIEIRSAREHNYADGAYTDTNKIYLSAEFVAGNVRDPDAISKVILKEYGHFLDARFDVDNTPREGKLFANYIRAELLTTSQLKAIAAIDSELVRVEQANPGDNPAFDLIGLSQLRSRHR